jgi:hypothetical protein
LKRKALDSDETTKFQPSDIEDAKAHFGELYTKLKAKLRIIVLGGDYLSIERRRATIPDARAALDPQGRLSRKRPAKKRSKYVEKRELTIFDIIQMHVKGAKYCSALDGRGIMIPEKWRNEGCPTTYAEAYEVDTGPNWRKRIQDEKYRIKRRYTT